MSDPSPATHCPHLLRSTLTGFLLLVVVAGAGAQTLTNAQRDAAEQRRIQERETQLREQQQTAPDARRNAPVAAAQRLPESESPCFPIHQLELRGEAAGQFGWVLDSLSGPQNTDSPLRKCLGTQGIGILLQRAQDAVVAKGFVTTRVLAQPQDLSSGSLVLTVVPGRIRTIRFADSGASLTSTATAVAAQPGDILNLRDVEQALENFKRVYAFKTAEEVNSLMGTFSKSPAWKEGTQIAEATLKPGTKVQMVVDREAYQAIKDGNMNFVGNWASFDNIPNQAFARNNLAITTDFKKDVGYVVELEIIKPLNAQIGIVGKQGSAGGGANQLNFLFPPRNGGEYFKRIDLRVLP